MSDHKPQSVGAARPVAPCENAIPDDQWAQLLNQTPLAEAIASVTRMSGGQQAGKSGIALRRPEARAPLRHSEERSHAPAQPAAARQPAAAAVQQPPEVAIQRLPEAAVERPAATIVRQPAAAAVKKPVEGVVRQSPGPAIQRPGEATVQRPLEAAVQQPPEKEPKRSEEEGQFLAEERQAFVHERRIPEGPERERAAPRISQPPRRPTPSGRPRHEHGATSGRARALAGAVLGAVLVHLVLGAVLAAWLLGPGQGDVRLSAEAASAPSPNAGVVPAWQGDVPAGAPADLAPAAGPPPGAAGPSLPQPDQKARPTSQAQANVQKTAALVTASNLAELKMISEAIAAQEEHPQIEPAPASRRPQTEPSALSLPAQNVPTAQPQPGAPAPAVARSDGPRVYLHYTASSPAASARARSLLAFLRERSLDTLELRPVDVPIRQGSVRYFFADDRPAARRVSEMLIGFYGPGESTAAGVLDLTHYRPRPRPGIVEIWIPNS